MVVLWLRTCPRPNSSASSTVSASFWSAVSGRLTATAAATIPTAPKMQNGSAGFSPLCNMLRNLATLGPNSIEKKLTEKSTEKPLEFPFEIPYTKKKVKNGQFRHVTESKWNFFSIELPPCNALIIMSVLPGCNFIRLAPRLHLLLFPAILDPKQKPDMIFCRGGKLLQWSPLVRSPFSIKTTYCLRNFQAPPLMRTSYMDAPSDDCTC